MAIHRRAATRKRAKIINSAGDTVQPISTPNNLLRLRNRRACPGEPYEPTFIEQLGNVISHAAFIPTAISNCRLMMSRAAETGGVDSSSSWQWWIAAAYGSALTAQLVASALFHSVCLFRVGGHTRYLFHVLDRALIFALSAATYTPWMVFKSLDRIGPNAAAWLRALTWLFAVLGIAYQYRYHARYRRLELALVVAYGLLPGYLTIRATSDRSGIRQMLVGTAIYASGLIFFTLDGVVPCAHTIWHFFVAIAAFVQQDATIRTFYDNKHLPGGGYEETIFGMVGDLF